MVGCFILEDAVKDGFGLVEITFLSTLVEYSIYSSSI
jgi:hypothetical protein